MKKDWEEEGYLDGLSTEEKETIVGWLNQIDFDAMNNERAKDIIHAVLRHIYVLIAREGSQLSLIVIHQKRFPVDKLLSMVEPMKIAIDYDDYCEFFEPEGKKWLKYLDAGAELCVLFSENYVMKLINKQDETN